MTYYFACNAKNRPIKYRPIPWMISTIFYPKYRFPTGIAIEFSKFFGSNVFNQVVEEVRENPPSRSAKLRVAKKIID